MSYFEQINNSITNVSSKMDVLFYEKINKEKHASLLQDCFVLGCFYEAVYRIPCEFFNQVFHKVEESGEEKKTKRKETGSYFTPRYISDFIVSSTIGPLVDQIESNKRIKDKVKAISKLTVCDPAMGGAIFLVSAHDYLLGRMVSANVKAKKKRCGLARLALKCLYGVDINPKAVEGSKVILNLNLAKWEMRSKLIEYAKIAG